jgi:hypothetical protein
MAMVNRVHTSVNPAMKRTQDVEETFPLSNAVRAPCWLE